MKVGIEIGTSLVVKAAAGMAGVGVSAGAYQASMDSRSRGENEPPDKGIAKMQADAAAMIVNSGVPVYQPPRGS